jgi:predicted RNA-binding Zn-ribbon protein involved in translation (DUF1610 family)
MTTLPVIGARAVCTYCFARLVFARTSEAPASRDVVSHACPRCGARVVTP